MDVKQGTIPEEEELPRAVNYTRVQPSAELLVKGRPWCWAAGAEGATASTLVQGTVAVTSRCSLGLTALHQSHSPPADAGLALEEASADDAGTVLYLRIHSWKLGVFRISTFTRQCLSLALQEVEPTVYAGDQVVSEATTNMAGSVRIYPLDLPDCA